MKTFVQQVQDAIIHESHEVTKDEALKLYEADSHELCAAANRIRQCCCSPVTSVCSVINARQGGCSENCSYCAQSAHWSTSCQRVSMIDPDRAVSLCLRALEGQVSRISLVTSGKAITGGDFERLLENFCAIKDQVGGRMALCASLGIISFDQLVALKEAGVVRYHHNLETSESFFPHICTTHTWADRVSTARNAKKAGLELCCGGIIGMGESREDRVELALAIRSLDVQSVPINVLTAIKGTPLEGTPPLCKEEILKTIAVFRFLMPRQVIRCAAGRKSLGDNGRDAFSSGANALISGDFLTVPGSSNEEDLAMLSELGYQVESFA